MSNIVEFKNNELNIEDLNKQIDKEIIEVEAISNRFKMGYKPKTIEEAEDIWKKILAPGESMKKRAEMIGDLEYKTPIEKLEDKFDSISEKEFNSKLILVK